MTFRASITIFAFVWFLIGVGFVALGHYLTGSLDVAAAVLILVYVSKARAP